MTKMPTTPSLFYFVNKDNSPPPAQKKKPKRNNNKEKEIPPPFSQYIQKKKGKGEHEKETNKRKSCVVNRGVSLAPVLRDLVQLFD